MNASCRSKWQEGVAENPGLGKGHLAGPIEIRVILHSLIGRLSGP